MSISIAVFLIFLFIICIPVVLVGVFVYCDAKARGMDPLLWTLLAVFAPGFIGLIIYLIMRRDHVKMSCPNCGGEVNQTFVSCPSCGQKLCASCVNCGFALQPEWKLCPHCGAEITEVGAFESPVVNKTGNKEFMIALIAILAVPIVLIITVVSAFALYTPSESKEYNDEFVYEMDVESVCVTSSDACGLTDSQREWIRQKQEEKEGVYAISFSKAENGEKTTDEFTGTYDIVYDYTIVVVNEKNGKAFVNNEISCGTGGSSTPFLMDSVEVFLTEADPADEEAVLYKNVFVVRTVSEYSMHWKYSDGREPEKLEGKQADSKKSFTLTLKNSGENNKKSYTIPLTYEQEFFTPFH